MTDKNAIKQWAAENMRGMLETNHPASIGHAVLHALTGYEAARTGQEPDDAALREGLAKGLEQWRLEEARKHAVEKAAAADSTDTRNADAVNNQIAYRNDVRDQAAAFLSKTTIDSGGHAVILLLSIFEDYRTGHELHDQTLAAGLGLAFDAWARREQEIAAAMRKPAVQA